MGAWAAMSCRILASLHRQACASMRLGCIALITLKTMIETKFATMTKPVCGIISANLRSRTASQQCHCMSGGEQQALQRKSQSTHHDEGEVRELQATHRELVKPKDSIPEIQSTHNGQAIAPLPWG